MKKAILGLIILFFTSSVIFASSAYDEPEVICPGDGTDYPWAPPTYCGKLHFKELSRDKSYETYDGLEFWLIEDNGYIRGLEESELVARQILINAHHKNVCIQGEHISPPANDGRFDNCPINDAGECLPRTVRLRVTHLEILN